MRRRIYFFFAHYGVILFFAVYGAIGLFCFRDYGCGPDEGMERQTSLVNFRYVIETLQIPVPESTTTWLAYLPNLHDYRDRYYGTALHFPLVLIESLANFQMQPAVFYGMRHFYTFLNFFLASICFYLLLKKRFLDKRWALLGTTMLILSPRIFAESFYNNKDVLFLAWYIISLTFIFRWFERKSIKNALIAGTFLAFTCNTRLNAIALFPLILIFAGADFLWRKDRSKGSILSIIIMLVVSIGVFYLITPNFWEHPIQTAIETFTFNRKHPNHGSDGNLFFGQLVDTTRVWYFIPVWIILTTPTLYLFFSVAGSVSVLWHSFKNRFFKYPGMTDFMDIFMLCAGLLPVIVIIGLNVIIYNGWRHCYFAYGSILYLAVVGLEMIYRKAIRNRFWNSVKKWGLTAAILTSFLVSLTWMIANHPYEYVYFNPFVREYAGYFSGDYWGVASRDLLRYIVETDERPLIVIDHSYTQSGSINRGLLSETERNRINLVYGPENADYILFSRDDKKPEEASFPGFEKVFSIQVDFDEIGIVFRKKEQ
ncbi:MAG: ArnT family glycosyltransferase [Flexilinea sp.]